MNDRSLQDLRREYASRALDEHDAPADPLALFQTWFDDAVTAAVLEPNAMAIATVGADGEPAARMVLLKGFDGRGFVFYTNYDSAKGRELAANPRASLLFFWGELERQVRIVGGVTRVSREESADYFKVRPLGSRLGAWASPQSEEVASRADLETRYADAERQHGDDPALPPFWGGFRVDPRRLEFWQGRRSRLHDRLVYVREGAGWRRSRLAP